jgi:hypothetical protein
VKKLIYFLFALILVSIFLFSPTGSAYAFSPDTNLSNADASFWGEDEGDYSGYSVAGAGDVNGDGFDDFLIGAYANEETDYFAGQTYLILGKASGWDMDFNLSNADASFLGEDGADYSGTSVAGAGDVNNDGYDDFLIGAPGDDDGGDGAGETYLILGKASGWSMNTSLSNTDASFIGEDAGDNTGGSVAGAGDVNHDGFADFLIGAYANEEGGNYAGQTYLILGKASGWTMDFDLSNADASFIGEDDFDSSGTSLAGAGDVNADGFADFLIGAPGDEDGGNYAGQTYLILGKASGWSMDNSLSNADASFIGEDEGDSSGYSVAGAGDINTDGFADFLISAPEDEEGGDSAGQTYLSLGKASGWSMDNSLSNADASFIGEDSFDYSGYSVAGAGDVNDDGFADFLIGAPIDEEGGIYAGQTYLILGKASGWSMDNSLSNANASFIGEHEDDSSGRSIAGAGDVNNDGSDDILIGAYTDADNGIDAGQTYLLLGEVPPVIRTYVGGEVSPVNKISLIAPWIALVACITASSIYLARRKKHDIN